MADTTITGLPNATTPLSGSERLPMDQAGVTVDATSQDVANLAGTAISTAVAAHAAAADPHPQYLTSGAEQPAGVVLAGPASGAAAAPTFRALTAGDVSLGTASTPQFAGLGLGTAAVSGWRLTKAGGVIENRASLTASSGTYTVDVTAANEFVTGAAIAGATTINLSNIASIPSGYAWRGVLSFSYTSGTVSWFTGNTGYTVKWDGGTAPTLTASDVETVVITVVGGGTTIEVAPLKGRS